MRPSQRTPDALRAVTLETGVNRYAEGSCLVAFGHTRVLVTASLEESVPPFLRGRGQGWVTAEYGMLPRATHTRGRREAAQGKQSGRTQEIQRLIGRSLRAVTDMKALGERQISLDCDVIQADGGTRTAAITGAWVALRLATKYLLEEKVISRDPILDHVAAISCGVFDGTPVLDLDYEEDSNAEADANFVLTGAGDIVEIQATGEKRGFTRAEFDALFGLARDGIDATDRDADGGGGGGQLRRRRTRPATASANSPRRSGELIGSSPVERLGKIEGDSEGQPWPTATPLDSSRPRRKTTTPAGARTKPPCAVRRPRGPPRESRRSHLLLRSPLPLPRSPLRRRASPRSPAGHAPCGSAAGSPRSSPWRSPRPCSCARASPRRRPRPCRDSRSPAATPTAPGSVPSTRCPAM